MQYQSMYIPKKPRYASLEIPPFRPHFIKFLKTVSYVSNFTSQCSQLEVFFLSKFCLKGGISIDAFSGPLGQGAYYRRPRHSYYAMKAKQEPVSRFDISWYTWTKYLFTVCFSDCVTDFNLASCLC